MSVHVIDTIKPKNQGTFPVVEAVDVKVSESKRLDAALNEKANQSDLAALNNTVATKAAASDLAETNATVATKANATDLAATNTTVSAKANISDVDTATANLQAQIDALVTPTTQDAEVQNARVDVNGTAYNTLKLRLDANELSGKSNFNKLNEDLYFDKSIPIYGELNATFQNNTITGTSNSVIVFGRVGEASAVTVEKDAGAILDIAFSVADSVIIGSEFYDKTIHGSATKATVNVPKGAKWVLVRCWNASLDTETKEEMVASVSIAGTICISKSVVFPEMYGAYGDGVHDDTTALQNAFDKAVEIGATVIMRQSYAISSPLTFHGKITGGGTLKLANLNTRISGAFIESDGDLTVSAMNFDCKSNVEFTVDDKFIDLNIGILHTTGKLTVDNCRFYNLYNSFIRCRTNNIGDIYIKNNVFDAKNRSNRFKASCIACVSAVNDKTTLNIDSNHFYGYTGEDDMHDNACAITASNTGLKEFNITNNLMLNLGRLATYGTDVGYSRLTAIDFYFNNKNINIKNNMILACNWSAIRVHGASNVKITDNTITLRNACNEALIDISDARASTGEDPVGVKDIIISNNTISSEPLKDVYVENVIDLLSLPVTANAAIRNVVIRDNHINALKCTTGIRIDDTVRNLDVIGNVIDAFYEDKTVTGIKTLDGTYSNTTIYVYNNKINTNGICINLSRATSIKRAIISQNNLYTNTSYCIYGQGDDSNIRAIANVMRGSGAIRNIGRAIRNIAECTSGYNSVGEDIENYNYSPEPTPPET